MAPAIDQIFPCNPTFTEEHIPDLAGKVVIVTGSTAGVGYQVATILYSKNATVYVAARSAEKANKAINDIRNTPECASSQGRLEFLRLDLADLKSIKASASEFLGKEQRLDILIHNAGLMTPPAGSKTELGHDLEMGTNCLGPFLFNQSLLPLVKETAKNAPANSVRIVWLSSMISHSVPDGCIQFDEVGNPKVLKNAMENYMQSKVGDLFLACELAKKVAQDAIISLSVNPGLMKTELQRHNNPIQGVIMGILFKGPRYGAYSELFAALSPSITDKENGSFIIPWGRIGPIPGNVEKALKPSSVGGTGVAERFWEWCEKETAPYK